MTSEQLKYIVQDIKQEKLDLFLPLLNQFMPKYEIATKARVAPFIANVAHESAHFRAVEEYASGEAYDTGDLAVRLGNTPEKDGDGQKYKGRGLIQITGKGNYKTCSLAIYGDLRLLQQPETLKEPSAAVESACWFWAKFKGLNAIADKPDNWTRRSLVTFKVYTKFQWIVRTINGGLNGLAEREVFLKRANEIL